MEQKKIELSYTNNIADRPNNFIRLCWNICRKYKMEISSMKGFDSDDRSYAVELTGREGFIEIKYDYETNALSYKIHDENIENQNDIISYIIESITKVNYKIGDVIFDYWGNQYIVKEDTDIPMSTNGARKSYKVKVECENGDIIEISDSILSPIE